MTNEEKIERLEQRVQILERNNVAFIDALEQAARAISANPMFRSIIKKELRDNLDQWLKQREAERETQKQIETSHTVSSVASGN